MDREAASSQRASREDQDASRRVGNNLFSRRNRNRSVSGISISPGASEIKLRLVRDPEQPDKERTYGQLFNGANKIGETLEDEDRDLEDGGEKVYGRTCIARGTYEIVLSFSNRFGRVMPEILSVPEFTGIRIHGGNSTADSLGCPLLGAIRTETGIRDCSGPNAYLIALLRAAEDADEESTIEIM